MMEGVPDSPPKLRSHPRAAQPGERRGGEQPAALRLVEGVRSGLWAPGTKVEATFARSSKGNQPKKMDASTPLFFLVSWAFSLHRELPGPCSGYHGLHAFIVILFWRGTLQ